LKAHGQFYSSAVRLPLQWCSLYTQSFVRRKSVNLWHS
jgi:hypothetical protein